MFATLDNARLMTYSACYLIVYLGLSVPRVGYAQSKSYVKSNTVEFQQGRYTLVEDISRSGSIRLEVSNDDTSATPFSAANVTGWSLPQDHRIDRVHLASWQSVSLFAILVTQESSQFHVYILKFPKPAIVPLANVHVASKHIYTAAHALDVLAVNGRFQGDGIVVVLGNLRLENGQRVPQSSAIYIDDCPSEDLISGKVTVLSK
jgi:hypothetical protein